MKASEVRASLRLSSFANNSRTGACHISIGAEVDVELARTKRQHSGHAIGPGWPQCVAIPDNECRAAEDLLDLGRTQADCGGSLLAFGDRYAKCGLGLSGTCGWRIRSVTQFARAGQYCAYL